MILIVDTETTGIDPKKDSLIELAGAVYDEEHGLLDCQSCIVCSKDGNNAAFDINRIDPALFPKNRTPHIDMWWELVDGCRAIVAHNASFDRQWLPATNEQKWLCSIRDIKWPGGTGKLETLALNHGVAVLPGHRAIYDVLTLVRVFDAVRAMGVSVSGLIDAALAPKDLWQSHQQFAKNDEARSFGFAWDAERKGWYGRFTKEESAAWPETMPFPVSLRSK
jgi:DNA polymerase-3 subunit epsilon